MRRSTLLENTVMLYIMTFSTHFLSLVTVPYQTRVLGPDIYGKIGFAQAFTTYIQLFLDFGFILSATQDVAEKSDDKKALSRILTAVFYCKLILGVVSLGIVIILCASVTKFREDVLLYILFYIYILVNSFLPDYLYRGLEKMSAITFRTVGIKLFFTVAIFVFLRSEEQYYVIPILNTLGVIAACIWAYWDLWRRFEVTFTKVQFSYVWKTLVQSSGYFLSRIASTIYSATNTVIIGFLYPGVQLGYYSSAEKLMTTAQSACSPIADSLYPYMVRNKDFKLIKKIMLVFMPVIVMGCIVVGIWAEPLCAIMFGEEFRASGEFLRYLLPVIVMTLPIYVLGFPTLSPLGIAKYANISVIAGALVHIIMLALLFSFEALTIQSICISTCITQLLILVIRLVVIIKKIKI